MSAAEETERPRGGPPRLSHCIAVGIELGVVATFAYHHSTVGVLLCGAYAWYSATWAFFALR